MCDVCSNDPKWKTPPNTEARQNEVLKALADTIVDKGFQIMAILSTDDKPGFFYSVGRFLDARPELLMTGSLIPRMGMGILNSIAALDDRREIDLPALAGTGPVSLPGFGSELRFVTVSDPMEAEMFSTIQLGGNEFTAIQVIWPDAEGRWPDDPAGWAYGPGTQPIYGKETT